MLPNSNSGVHFLIEKTFSRLFNAIFGKLGRLASEDVILQLISSKCLPVLLYGLDACPVNTADRRSLEFVFTRCLMKLFSTSNISLINDCCAMFDLKTVHELTCNKKLRFLDRYSSNDNIMCVTLSQCAVSEINMLYLNTYFV